MENEKLFFEIAWFTEKTYAKTKTLKKMSVFEGKSLYIKVPQNILRQHFYD